MEIVDKRKEKIIGAEYMKCGSVYRIRTDIDTYIAMRSYNGNLHISEEDSNDYLLTDLEDGSTFVLCEDEFIEIEELNAKLIIE